jgi:ABC-2 type transport system ATP-binding protein
MTDVMIEAQGLGKRYGDFTALEGATFQVRRGEVLGFLGPNGAGKTTTMKILTCFIAPTEGTARVGGSDIFEDPMGVRRSIGYLPESTPLYTEMLVLEYLEWSARMRGLDGEAARKRIKKVVEETTLGEVIGKEIRTLSKGFRQRVGLAQALIHEPPILILDEPMSGLDPNQASEIRDLIRAIGKERTVILSTHNLAEVEVACNRVLIVARGKIVANDTPEHLRETAGKARYIVSVLLAGTSEAKAREAFAKLEGIERVSARESVNGELKLELLPASASDMRASVWKCAVENQLTLVELRKEDQNLEGVFRELTLGGNAHA